MIEKSLKGMTLLFFCLILISCSGLRSVKSVKTTSPIEINASLADWPRDASMRSPTDEFDVAVANDDEFVYIAISFKNNRTQAMARDFGFRVFFDQQDSFRRSFGIVYPVGYAEILAEFPGARRAYLENPGWRNMPENRSIVESVEQNMANRVQIISRSDRRSAVRPVNVSMEQLHANSIEVAMDFDRRRMMVEMKIPIRPTRDREFSADPDGNGTFLLGFEIVPPDYTEVTGETPTYETVESRDMMDQYGGRRQSRTQMQVSNPQLYAMLNYSYQNWIRVRLE